MDSERQPHIKVSYGKCTGENGMETRPIIDEAIARLEKELPPIFARQKVKELLGGAIAPGTLANLGRNGPPYILVGRNAVFERTSFLAWLRTRMEMPR